MTNLRAWAIGADGGVLDSARSADGMGMLDAGQAAFEAALIRVIDPWLPGSHARDVVICGTAGARQGWHEVPYRPVPAPAHDRRAVTTAPARDPRVRVSVIHGMSQTNPPDVMRGEETQVAGLLLRSPDFQGVVALPGTHAKWARIVDGEIFHFASFMTGELFALLAERSVLRHSLDPQGHDAEAFTDAFEETLSRPERAAARVLGLRSEDLLLDADPRAAASRLSGYLLGLEFAGARAYWLGQPIALLASGALAERYRTALEVVGADYRVHDPEACVLDGLRAVRAGLRG
ncbi:2-dehydro-3-deoxygalactonokinase [Halovulum dunhuangense]|nr:2-dehydro-3-deoxygalactonokinase [Halovulum dunhuangense]